MKTLPAQLLQSLRGVNGFDPESFLQVHQTGDQVTSIRINPAKAQWKEGEWSLEKDISATEKDPSFHRQLQQQDRVPWSEFGYYLDRRPSFTFDPLFHAGCYYVQEASSMFLEQAFRQLLPLSSPLKVLDLCAAPGGKSTHIQSLLSPGSLLVSNEVIRSRSHVLTDNIMKWGAQNVVVTNNDPLAFQKLPGFFDVMVVDAPCSGSGLFRKDADAIDEWSPANVQLCYQRQQRILADALPALKEDGLLVYSTCSYSREEDEDIADWLMETFDMVSLPLSVNEEWGVVTTASKSGAEGYRFYPDKVKGEGLFLACFRKTAASPGKKRRSSASEKVTAREKAILTPWLKTAEVELVKEGENFYALSALITGDYEWFRNELQVVYRGVALGQIMKERLVPHHALAMSSLLGDGIEATELPYDEAIRYLQRQDLSTQFEGRGWQLVRYRGFNLGWVNVLPGRINNYYPKELRILKRSADSFEK